MLLQWGHRLSAMETLVVRITGNTVSLLQWGYRLSAMETNPLARVSVIVLVPSMGPPPFGDGNRPGPLRSSSPPRSFNGATAFRRWKRLVGYLYEVDGVTFNGATAFRRWKPQNRGTTKLYCKPFNGATAFRRWKLIYSCPSCAGLCSLQWGHRLSAMETSIFKLRCCQHNHPSMGPPPFGDGNLSTHVRVALAYAPFNGATAFRRWKRAYLSSGVVNTTILQWGHRLSAMETP